MQFGHKGIAGAFPENITFKLKGIVSYNDEVLKRRVYFVMERMEKPRDVIEELDKLFEEEITYDGDQITVN